ncbi:hypothetical protein [Capnocytophaga catalasegens]|uniref:Internalin-J n=1 Tax=Capnocytophaga catalasegens TaxID=1004260 RepID=A0AAV5AST0_9FLAO|nr:hypothetical protein [Capnocytophaga catalasegens]GIZ16013.1 hypothetical protein RCZ03_20130 [Capnocytophaga catalasegens]GJM50428.1 hypothetical protein RCZ15_14010 [Capnocytophaga catalasegens]GJM51816.1 hypothetical protein RCZ16_01340 [Capnocytophaga catalasegens]
MKKLLKKTAVLLLVAPTLWATYSCNKDNDSTNDNHINVQTGITSGVGVPNSSTKGTYYFDTNTKTLYKNENGTWKVIATLKMNAGASLLNGTGAPELNLGKNGDYYVDTTRSIVFVKENNEWKPIVFPSEDSIITFKDANFKANLVKYFDANKDGEISVGEAKKVTIINVSGLGIVDLTGIEWFHNLQELNISNNKITSLNAKNLTNLKTIIATGNNFRELDLSRSFHLSATTRIVKDNANLNHIKVKDKDLADRLNRAENTNKYTADGVVDQLIDFKDAKFKEYVLSVGSIDRNGDKEVSVGEAKAFTDAIHPDNNKGIRTLEDIVYFKNISRLQVTGEYINSVTIEDFPNLESLTIGNCSLTQLKLSNVPKLTTLSLNGNKFTAFPQVDAPAITSLSLNNNSILVDITNINSLTNITKLALLGNPKLPATIDLTGLTKLIAIDVQIVRTSNNTQIQTIKVATSSLANLLNNAEQTNKYKADDGGSSSGDVITITDNSVKRKINDKLRKPTNNSSFTKTELATITEVDIYNGTDISWLKHFTGLISLKMYASISTLDISTLIKLKTLELGGNTLTTVNTGNVSTLTQVTIASPNLKTLDLRRNASLNKVDIKQNMNIEKIIVATQTLADKFNNENVTYYPNKDKFTTN